jgi:hypothetical protein
MPRQELFCLSNLGLLSCYMGSEVPQEMGKITLCDKGIDNRARQLSTPEAH